MLHPLLPVLTCVLGATINPGRQPELLAHDSEISSIVAAVESSRARLQSLDIEYFETSYSEDGRETMAIFSQFSMQPGLIRGSSANLSKDYVSFTITDILNETTVFYDDTGRIDGEFPAVQAHTCWVYPLNCMISPVSTDKWEKGKRFDLLRLLRTAEPRLADEFEIIDGAIAQRVDFQGDQAGDLSVWLDPERDYMPIGWAYWNANTSIIQVSGLMRDLIEVDSGVWMPTRVDILDGSGRLRARMQTRILPTGESAIWANDELHRLELMPEPSVAADQ